MQVARRAGGGGVLTVAVPTKTTLSFAPDALVPSSSLEPLETPEQAPSSAIDHRRYGSADHDSFPTASAFEQSFRHSGWAADRKRVYDALMTTHQGNRRCDAFANCGSSLFLNSSGDDLVLTSNHCHDRLCQPCQTARRALLVANVTEAIAQSRLTTRFLTLTLRAREARLLDQLQRITDCFKCLRRRKFWKESIIGGAFFIECKLGANSGAWHVHLHVLVESHFIDQRTLSSEWLAVTGDSYIVDVRAITNPEKRAAYVTKYATKPADASVIRSPDALQEFVTAIKGKRLFQCFGTWKDFALEESSEGKSHLAVIGNLETLISDAKNGDPTAKRWVEAAVRKWPSLASHLERPPPSQSVR